MDQNIYFTNNEFDFSHISITQPTSVQGGAYFTKIRYNGEPLYIQPSKCSTKQGLSETNKKAYIDLMFTCLLYTSPSPRDRQKSRMPSSA